MNSSCRSIYVFAYGSNLNFGDLNNHEISLKSTVQNVHRAILFGYELAFTRRSKRRGCGVLDVRQKSYAVAVGALIKVTKEELDELDDKEGVDVKAYQREEVDVWDMERREFCKAYVYTVVDPKPYVEPNNDYVGIVREGYRCFGLPEVILDAAVDNKPFSMSEFFQWLLRGGAIGSRLQYGGAFTHREDWGGEHFVIGTKRRDLQEGEDIAYIQRNREECRRLVDFMYFMKQFAYTEDDPMRYRYVIGMLGVTCHEYANASYVVLCEKLIARAVELLK